MEFSSEKIAESFSPKVLQIFCSKSENQNKRLIFQKRVVKNVLLDTQVAVLNSTRSHSTKLKKKSIVQFLVFFQNVPLDTVGAGVTTLPSVFCSEPKLGENLKTVSFNLLFPQNVPLEMMNATLTMLPISCEVVIKFQIMCGNDEYFNFSHKVQLLTVLHWTRKSTLKIVPQGFRSNYKRIHLYENFQRVVFSKKFLWKRKRRFWQAPRNLFLPKVTLSHRSKSGKKEWYLNFPSEIFSQFVLLYT